MINPQSFKHSNNDSGFVLLYALLVSSIVLTVGLSLSDIFYKQLLLSSVGQSSQVAYYAADSFRECLHYGDSILSIFGRTEGTGTDDVLVCTDPDISGGGANVIVPGIVYANEVDLGPVDYSYSYSDFFNNVTEVKSCAKATIKDSGPFGYIFRISGFNVPCSQINTIAPRVVQRVITMQS